jgi:DNA-directed RNA polymerase delta subunit
MNTRLLKKLWKKTAHDIRIVQSDWNGCLYIHRINKKDYDDLRADGSFEFHMGVSSWYTRDICTALNMLDKQRNIYFKQILEKLKKNLALPKNNIKHWLPFHYIDS